MHREAAIAAITLAGDEQLHSQDETMAFALFDPAANDSVQPVLAASQGRVVDRQQTRVVLEFPDAATATACLADLRKRMMATRRGRQRANETALRIGIDFGAIMVGDDNLYGYRTNVASDLAGHATAQHMCLSKAAFADVAAQRTIVAQGRETLRPGGSTGPLEAHLVLADIDTHAERILSGHIGAHVRVDTDFEHRSSAMTATDLLRALQRLGLGVNDRAHLMGLSSETVQAKLKGKSQVTEQDLSWLQMYEMLTPTQKDWFAARRRRGAQDDTFKSRTSQRR